MNRMNRMNNQLELYQQLILEHNRKPRNFGKPEKWTHKAEGFNPLCGDHIWVYLVYDKKKSVIQKVNFHGTSCAICKASASIMTNMLIGLSEKEAAKLFHEFHDMLNSKLDPSKEKNKLGKLTVFSTIWKYPLRIKCASLAWHTFRGALKNTSEPISTEEEE